MDSYFSSKIKDSSEARNSKRLREEEEEAQAQFLVAVQPFMKSIASYYMLKETQGRINVKSDTASDPNSKQLVGTQVRLRYGLKESVLDFRADVTSRKVEFTRRGMAESKKVNGGAPLSSRSLDFRTMSEYTLELIWREALDWLI